MQDDTTFLFKKKKIDKGLRQKLRSLVSPNTSEGEHVNPNLTCHCTSYFCHLKDFFFISLYTKGEGTKTV